MAEKQRKLYFRSLLAQVPYNTKVTDNRVIEILKYHPDWEAKSRGGTLTVVKRRHNGDFKLWLVDSVGRNVDDISWSLAVKVSLGFKSDPVKKHTYKVHKAARLLVHDQVLSFKKRQGVPKEFEVDHKDTDFAVLLKNWAKSCELTFENIEIVEPPGGIPTFADKDLANNWKVYHEEHATLQALTHEEHRRVTTQRKRTRLVEDKPST